MAQTNGPGTGTEKAFVYQDPQGNPVLTNKPDMVQGLARPKNQEQAEKQGKPGPAPFSASAGKERESSSLGQVVARVKSLLSSITQTSLSGQSRILTLGGIAGVFMLAIMMLSQNPALKLLMRWLLILRVFGTTAKLYFTQGDLRLKAKGSAEQLQQTQQQKDQHLQQLESTSTRP